MLTTVAGWGERERERETLVLSALLHGIPLRIRIIQIAKLNRRTLETVNTNFINYSIDIFSTET